MDLDDSFTEGLVQRARARKEYLNKKKMEFVSVSKKRAVLIDEHQVKSDEPPNKSPKCESAHTAQGAYSLQDKENAEMQDESLDAPFVPVLSASKTRGLAALKSNYEAPNKSPKWQSTQTPQTTYSTHDAEKQNVNLDAPFVPASRARGLAALRNRSEDEDSNSHAASEFQVNNCNTYVYSTNSSELCSGQRSRLANIAADIRLWEDDTRRPTNGASSKSHTIGPNFSSQTNTFCNPGESSSGSSFPVSVQSKGGMGTQSSHKRGNVEGVSVGGRREKLQAWDAAVMATLNNDTKKSEGTKVDPEYSDESIDENDFAENYNEIKPDHHGDIKMELGYSPFKQTKEVLKPQEQKNFEAAIKLPSPTVKDSGRANVDPAELPLSARKALFEKALMNGSPKVNRDITDHTLSVAQRAAMFENASKGNCGPRRANFKEPRPIVSTNLSKFDRNGNKSPLKTIQPAVKVNPSIVKAPPIKEPPPLSSSPISAKHVGNHTGFVQQKLAEKSNAVIQQKEVPVARKKEISSLVHQWEKLSSSSEKNSSSEERNYLASEEPISSDSDAEEETSDAVEETSDAVEDTSNHDLGSETENAVSEDEQIEDCVDGDSHMAENVFYPPDTEKVSLKSDEDTTERKLSTASSQNTGSIMSSLSCSGISSYTDDSSHCASRSQSCTSGSSVRSYDVSPEKPQTRKEEVSQTKKEEVPLLYTVSFYRKQKQETRLTPVRTIVRNRKESSPTPSDVDCSEYIQERIKALQEEILRQQTVISQTSQALNLCSATAEFSGSMEQVEGERLLLISTQKRQACLNEVTRLKSFGTQGENVADGKGTLTINELQLPLKREFITSQLEGKGTDTVHYFLCLIRHGAQVIVTQMMSTEDKTSDGALSFSNHIQLQNLPADFSVIFEVYALQTKKEVLSHEKKYHIKREHSKIRLTPKGKKSDGKILLPAISSPGGPNAVRSPSFGVVGYTRFNLLNCTKKTFTLDKVPFSSPLEGVLRVRLQLHAEHKVKEKGFLTMFEDVSGFGAWHRRWCALDTSQLSYWKYPDEEHKKEPAGIIDLKQCVTAQVKQAPRDVCARSNTFQLVTVRPQEKGDKNTLITRSVNTLTTTKHLLSADTKEERILWCNKLNEALASVRKWDPRALRPVETMQD